MLHDNRKLIFHLPKMLDTLLCILCWWTAYFIRFKVLKDGEANLGPLFLKLGIVLVISTLYSFEKNGLYLSQRFTSRYREILTTFKANLMANIIFLVLIYFFASGRISRLTIVIYFGLSTLGFISLRLSVRNFLRYIRSKGRNLRHVLLVGDGDQLINYIHTIYSHKDSGVRFMGWIDPGKNADEFNIPIIEQSYDDYFQDKQKPELIILSYQSKQSEKANLFIRRHYNDIIPIQLLPDLTYSMVGHRIEDFGGVPLITVNQPQMTTLDVAFKRFIDLFCVVIGLIIISPLLLLIAAAVKLSSPGPIFFGQKRIGLDGAEFTMWKFRSMRQATDNEQTQEWSNKDNPRKTKVGNFLRQTSLDELPQLWNVLLGNMSLVGPRPEQPYFVEKFRHEIPGYMLKHKMKPGISGWAQVNGWRGDTDLHKRIECDIYYIKNWSLWLDIKILFLTFWKGFIHQNAY